MDALWHVIAGCDEHGAGRLIIMAGSRCVVCWLWPDELDAALTMVEWRNDTLRRAALLEAAA